MSGARKLKPAQPWELELNPQSPLQADPMCIGVGTALTHEQVLNIAIDSRVKHICQKDGHMFDKEVQSSRWLLENKENFRKFPISSILTPGHATGAEEQAALIINESFNSSTQKPEILSRFMDVMQAKGLSQTVIEDVVAVSDELFTNAVFNAPFVDPDKLENPDLDRFTVEVKLEDGKAGRIFLAQDQSRLVVGCSDPYGTLNLTQYLKKIRNTYQKGPAAAIDFGDGGAGIGSYIIFNMGTSLYFGVWPGQETVLCCVFPLGVSNRKRMQMVKHLHWIQP